MRGGFGIFYNRLGLDSVVHAFEQGAPYAQTYDYNVGSARWAAATLAAALSCPELGSSGVEPSDWLRAPLFGLDSVTLPPARVPA